MQKTKTRPLEKLERLRKAKGIGQIDLLVHERTWRWMIEGKRFPSRDTVLSLLTNAHHGLGLKEVSEVNKYLAMMPYSWPVNREEFIKYRLRSICLKSTGVANVAEIFRRRGGMVLTMYMQAQRGPVEELLRAADEAAKTLIEEFPIAAIACDKNGRVQIWNTAAETMFGWKPEEVLDRSMPFTVSDNSDAPIAARLKGKKGSFIDVCIWRWFLDNLHDNFRSVGGYLIFDPQIVKEKEHQEHFTWTINRMIHEANLVHQRFGGPDLYERLRLLD